MRADELAELRRTIDEVMRIANDMGLDPYPTHFEIVPTSIMYEFGAYGLPGRYHHWTRGKAYHLMKTHYDLGLNRIYELVINTNPAMAFLLENNRLIENKFVVAHVIGHTDFFKNNIYFQAVPQDMVERAALNAERIQRYEFEHGYEEVERFLDAILSIEQHVNPYMERRQLYKGTVRGLGQRPEPKNMSEGKPARSALSKKYDDLFAEHEEEREPARETDESLDPDLRLDLLLFLQQHASKLDDWQRDLIAIVRAERLYFQPQIQTKIMNEGWATYWHTRILREIPLRDDEFFAFAQLHASVQAPYRGGINPYALGFNIWENIERQYDTLESARRAMLDIRANEDDVSFLRNYLTQEIIEEMDLFIYRYQDDEWRVVDNDWEQVRDALIRDRVNGGSPVIEVVDGDYGGNRELYLRHCFDGRELDLKDAEKTLQNVANVWGRGVHLETTVNGQIEVFHSVPNLG